MTQYIPPQVRATLEELGVNRVKSLVDEAHAKNNNGIDLWSALNAFRAERATWPWWKRLAWRWGMVQ